MGERAEGWEDQGAFSRTGVGGNLSSDSGEEQRILRAVYKCRARHPLILLLGHSPLVRAYGCQCWAPGCRGLKLGSSY